MGAEKRGLFPHYGANDRESVRPGPDQHAHQPLRGHPPVVVHRVLTVERDVQAQHCHRHVRHHDAGLVDGAPHPARRLRKLHVERVVEQAARQEREAAQYVAYCQVDHEMSVFRVVGRLVRVRDADAEDVGDYDQDGEQNEDYHFGQVTAARLTK